VLTDRGTEYCGAREHHEYELYLAVENIDHSRTKARHERFHKTLQDEFYSTAFRKTLYPYFGTITGRPGPVVRSLQPEPSAFGQILLRQNSDAELLGFPAARLG